MNKNVQFWNQNLQTHYQGSSQERLQGSKKFGGTILGYIRIYYLIYSTFKIVLYEWLTLMLELSKAMKVKSLDLKTCCSNYVMTCVYS